MNFRIYPFVALVLGLLASCVGEKKPAEVVVIVPNGNKTIELSAPVGDSYVYQNKYTATLTDDTICAFQVGIDKIGIAKLSVGRQQCDLILQPNDRIEICFVDPNNEGDIRFSGTHAAGQMHFNAQTEKRNVYAFQRRRNYSEAPLDTIPEKMFQNFVDMAQAMTTPFETLYKEKKIDKEYLRFVQGDITCFYMAQLAQLLTADAKSHLFDSTALYGGYQELIEKIYQTYPLSNQHPKYLSGSYYIENYLVAQDVDVIQKGTQEITDAFSQKSNYTHALQSIKQPDALEYALALEIISKGVNNKQFDSTVVTLYDDFSSRFNQSVYLPLLKPYADEVSLFQKKIAKDFSPQVSFVENREQLNKLTDVLEQLKGTPLFIDYWFSTCGPCRDQMKRSAPLKKFLADNGIQMLYISVDADDRDELWQQCIKYFDLDGMHLRTTRALHQDIAKTHGITLYPSYMVVNKKGEIVMQSSVETEYNQEFFDELKEALK